MSFRAIGINIVDLVEVFATTDADDLIAGVATVVVALADVVFDDDYIVVGFFVDVAVVVSLSVTSVLLMMMLMLLLLFILMRNV